MSTPSKRRKLNNSSKTSPAVAPKNLDFFFGKKRQDAAIPSTRAETSSLHQQGESQLTDEQLARKIQAEWDQKDGGRQIEGQVSLAEADRASYVLPVAEQKPQEEGITSGEGNTITSESTDVKAGSDGTPFSDSRKNRESSGVTSSLNPFSSGKNTLSLQSMGSAEDTITSTIPFDESPLVFQPSGYIRDLQSHWAAEGGNASYALLTRCFVLVNSTQSRIKIVDTLVNLLRVIIEGDPSSLLPAVRIIYCCPEGFQSSCILLLSSP